MGISRLLGAAKLQSAPVADNPRYAAGVLQKFGDAGGQALSGWGRGCPEKNALLSHMCYRTNFRWCRSSRFGV